MPQGIVLGPLLFLAYINDLPEIVDHSVSGLFADDCLVYKPVKSDADAMRLQENLETLEEWEKLWQMQFRLEKCRLEDQACPVNVFLGKLTALNMTP